MSAVLPRLKSVKALAGSTLKLVWRDGDARLCDLTGLIARSKALAPLAQPAIFGKPKTIDWGAGVGWPNGLDVSAQTLHRISREQESFEAVAFRAWQAALGLSGGGRCRSA